ncbi:hypothetical protein [Amycolatopsis sp. NPDC049159]|uniref:hypothetical protein n=1 Tax=Amycolatopsis sp. NPDC049159 TaxID=3157210 RepID=UPI0033CC03A3
MRSRDVVRRPAARVRSVTGRRLSSLSAPVQYNGLGTAGFVLGLVGLVICVLWMAAFGKAVSDTANGLPTAGAAPSAAAAQHAVVLEVTTAAKANVQRGSGFTANSQGVLEKGKSRRQALSMDDLAFTRSPSPRSTSSWAPRTTPARSPSTGRRRLGSGGPRWMEAVWKSGPAP